MENCWTVSIIYVPRQALRGILWAKNYDSNLQSQQAGQT